LETLISHHPATMTHAALGEKGRKQIGITDGMVRISASKSLFCIVLGGCAKPTFGCIIASVSHI
jgi:hypothetical protein